MLIHVFWLYESTKESLIPGHFFQKKWNNLIFKLEQKGGLLTDCIILIQARERIFTNNDVFQEAV